MKKVFILPFLLFITASGCGQEPKRLTVRAAIENGDTIVVMNLPTVFIYGDYAFGRKHEKLVRNIRKVYPFARLAGEKLNEYSIILAAAADEKEVKEIMRQAEDDLLKQYRADLEKLTISQGKILIKLVDRETGHCSYELVQDLRGEFRAFFWQSFARIFGMNLKTEYDPLGTDKDIEEIVSLIERGML
jgi:hypothetical protein